MISDIFVIPALKNALLNPKITPCDVLLSPDTSITIRTEYVNDYEGKLITQSTVTVHNENPYEFTSEGPRVNSDSADNDLDELLSNDPDWVALLEEKEND